jgi:hypothetical protein
MKVHRRALGVFAIAMAMGAGALLVRKVSQYRQQEVVTIGLRYTELRAALTNKDTNAARALFAPEFRGGAHRSFDLLAGFAKPMSDISQIRLTSQRAEICPEPMYQNGAYSGGHTIEIVKRDGSWYFTGKHHVD